VNARHVSSRFANSFVNSIVLFACAAVSVLACAHRAAATVGTFTSSRDNTLYEPGIGSLSNGGTYSNGAGDYLFAGRTGQPPSLSIRRALIGFDVSTIPADAQVNSATLTLRLTKSADGGAATVSLHRALASWGEGLSHAPGSEGEGTFSMAGDATWYHRFYDTQFWINEGGDYDPIASSATTVGTTNTFYAWNGAGLAADVQRWLDNPADNNGWFVVGEEGRERTAKRFDTRKHTDPNRRPRLVIDYTLVAAWNVDADGDWSAAGNWSTGVVPNGIGAAAKLGGSINQPRTITLDVPVTLGSLRFDGAHAYTVAGTNALTFDATSGSASITVTNGSHTIAAPVTLMDPTTFNVIPAQSLLALSGPISAAAVSVTKDGAGALHVRPVHAHVLTINAGKVKVTSNPPAPTSVLRSLSIAGGSAPTAQLDLTDNALVVDYDAGNSPLPTIRAQVTSGYADATWEGPGIVCSGPGSGTTHGMGYAEASEIFSSFPATFLGESVDDTSVVLRYTRYGDADLDGLVNLNDFNRLAASFGLTGDALWTQGDFNYDGIVNLQDFNRLAANFGLSAAGQQVAPEDWSNLAAAVPEPAGAVPIGAIAWAILGRRRRTPIS
jgi:hypothetical protein